MNDAPIAVFDSGLGGLTVVRAIGRHLPGENIVYFGDTARVPYGSKSPQTILQFSEQNCQFLLQFEPKLIVVACNTASALALRELESRVSVPLVGVIEPGAADAVRRANGGTIAVLATEATVASGAYLKAIQAISPRTAVTQRRCPSLVPLIEEGRPADDPILRMLVAEYLEDVRPLRPAVVLLGCTHYPLVEEAIAEVMNAASGQANPSGYASPHAVQQDTSPLTKGGPRGVSCEVVDSADATARQIRGMLEADDALSGRAAGGRLRCYVSDNPQRFREVGARFLGSAYGGIRDVAWVTPEQFFHEPLLPGAASEQAF